jgi:hypothetical protein
MPGTTHIFRLLASVVILAFSVFARAEECQPHGFGCKSCVADGVYGALWVAADCTRRCDKVCGNEKAASVDEPTSSPVFRLAAAKRLLGESTLPATESSEEPHQSSQGGPGMRVTFKSCGYQATALKVACTNASGIRNEQPLLSGDTTPVSCATRLATACSAVGYRIQQQGDSVLIFGSGISVTAVGPVFESKDF